MADADQSRQCLTCGETKSMHSFWPRSAQCKACKRDWDTLSRKANDESVKGSLRRLKNQNWEKAQELLELFKHHRECAAYFSIAETLKQWHFEDLFWCPDLQREELHAQNAAQQAAAMQAAVAPAQPAAAPAQPGGPAAAPSGGPAAGGPPAGPPGDPAAPSPGRSSTESEYELVLRRVRRRRR